MTTYADERLLGLALALEEHGAVRVNDPTGSFASLTRVTPKIRRELEQAADLAGVEVEITKVGDEARARVKR